MNIIQILFSFKNRIDRKQYWIGYFINFLLWLVPMVVFSLFGIADIFVAQDMPVPEWLAAINNPNGKAIATLILIPFIVVAVWTMLAVTVKRFHDVNLSGWFALLAVALTLVPILGTIIFLVGPIIIGCIKGTPGANKYGPAPAAE